MSDTHAWLTELPLAAGPPDLRMGTRAMELTRWLAEDSSTERELAEREALAAAHPEFVEIRPGFESELEELMSLVEIHIGDRLRRDIEDPLLRLAVSVPDDVLLMSRSEGRWVLVGGSLLFPNQWTLDEKMGGCVTEIHGPVDGYDELLADRVAQFFDRLSPARPVWRRNWFFHDDPSFFQPDRIAKRAIDDPADVEGLWIRSEWQTLRRLAFSEMIVFTVKTQVAPIAALADRSELASQMVTFLESASPRSLENKDADGRHLAIIDYLLSQI